ncbi:MAG TPA: 6-bladed beta-propeller [Candidatus Desulfaltia sp.]|nr:6-bladed beta-propeller [Candidatus Desulfaltia sp.]
MKMTRRQMCIWMGIFLGFIVRPGLCALGEDVKIRVENGVTVIYNPKTPVPVPGTKTRLVLEEDLTIGQMEPLFSDLVEIAVDDQGEIYALDRKDAKISVFDSRGVLLRTIGKKGQGPGELQGPREIRITPQKEIMITDGSTRQLVFFTLQGQFLRNVSTARLQFFNRPRADSRGDIVADVSIVDQEYTAQLKKLGPSLEPKITISSVALLKYPNFNPFFPRFTYEIGKDDIIIWGLPTKYEIHIWSREGKPLRKIVKDYDPVMITENEKKERTEGLITSGINIIWPKSHNAYDFLFLDDEGRIFARTYEKPQGENTFYHDVFNDEGRYIARVPLPTRPYVWKRARLCTIEEDEEGYRSIKAYKSAWE